VVTLRKSPHNELRGSLEWKLATTQHHLQIVTAAREAYNAISVDDE
jgi:hypothetical protein